MTDVTFPRRIPRASTGVEATLRRRWLVARGDTSGAQVTHRSLAGGNYAVDSYHDLLTVLSTATRLGYPESLHFLTELRTPIHPMILDFDYAFSAPVPEEEWLRILQPVQDVMRQVFPACDTRVFVAVAPVAFVQKKQLTMCSEAPQVFEQFHKSGIHVYWPGVLVDTPTALRLRVLFIKAMEIAMGYSHPTDEAGKRWPPWATIIDESVLKANGLRMLYAHKAEKCEQCSASRKRPATDLLGAAAGTAKTYCPACDGRGVLDCGRPYKPLWVLDAAGRKDEEKSERFVRDAVYALEKTTVRTSHSAMPVAPQFAQWMLDLPVEMPRQFHARPGGGGGGAGGGGALGNNGISKTIGGTSHSFLPDENADGRLAERIAALERFLNESTDLTGGLEPQSVRKLYRATSNHYFLAVGSNRYCNNVKRAHHHQDVYYLVSQRAVWQCCWSQRQHTTDTNMQSDCRSYRSHKVYISEALRQLLFNPHTNYCTLEINDIWRRYRLATFYVKHHPSAEERRMLHWLMARAQLPLLLRSQPDCPLAQLMMCAEQRLASHITEMHLPRLVQ